MITRETLECWLATAPEDEHLEFKEARQQYDSTKLLRYCVALANEGGGHLVLGVSDKRPRRVVGTYAVGFESLIDFVHSAAPLNRFVEQVVREEVSNEGRGAHQGRRVGDHLDPVRTLSTLLGLSAVLKHKLEAALKVFVVSIKTCT